MVRTRRGLLSDEGFRQSRFLRYTHAYHVYYERRRRINNFIPTFPEYRLCFPVGFTNRCYRCNRVVRRIPEKLKRVCGEEEQQINFKPKQPGQRWNPMAVKTLSLDRGRWKMFVLKQKPIFISSVSVLNVLCTCFNGMIVRKRLR